MHSHPHPHKDTEVLLKIALQVPASPTTMGQKGKIHS